MKTKDIAVKKHQGMLMDCGRASCRTRGSLFGAAQELGFPPYNRWV